MAWLSTVRTRRAWIGKMKLLFLVLVISSLTLAWFASQQPASKEHERVVVNLPRVNELKLIGETSGSPGSGPADHLPGPGPQRIPVGYPADVQAAGPKRDAVPADMGNPLLAGLSRPPADTVPLEASERASEAVQGSDQCLVASGFESENAAAQWLGRLADEYQLTGKTWSQSVPREPLHWVLVPPLENRREGLKLLKALQVRGLDSYLITQGENRNAISLGLFKSLRAAQSVLRQRQEAGIDAVLTVFPRSRDVHSVVVKAADLKALPGAVTENITIKFETEACKVLHS